MLKTNLLHPEILNVLGSSGHGSRVLIADGNYPFSTGSHERAKRVFLNLSSGMLSVTDVLKVIKEAIVVESYFVMEPPDKIPQSIHDEFVEILGENVPVKKVNRSEFYEEVKSTDTCLVIATGETKRFANILLTIGVVKY
jgi:L-fucose mutarotase